MSEKNEFKLNILTHLHTGVYESATNIMAKFDEKKMPYDKQNAALDMFCLMLSLLKSKDDIYNLLKDMFNRKERMMFVRRFVIAIRLVEKHTYIEIRKELHCADATIARVQRWLNFGRGGYKKAIEAILKKQKHLHTGVYESASR